MMRHINDRKERRKPMKNGTPFRKWVVFALAVYVVGFGAFASAEEETAA